LTERFFSLWVDKVKHIVEWLAWQSYLRIEVRLSTILWPDL
jgi:hypothetical protein